jgi:hypothetical protein
MAENLPGKVVIIQKKPRPQPLAQTQIDHDRCIERRRCNAAVYDRMAQILNAVLGGKATKQNLMDLAEKIAAQKQIKIDRAAKRIKEGLICWFCENACDLAVQEASPQHFSLEAWSQPDDDGLELELPSLLREDDLTWVFDSDSIS